MRTFFLVFTIALLYSNSVFSQVIKVESIGITVSDLDRSVKFYTEVLGFEKISEEEVEGTKYELLQGVFGIRMHIARLRLGDEIIVLTDYLTSGGRSIPEDFKSNDLAFQHIAIVVSDMEKAYRHLRKFKVSHVSTGPQTLPQTIPEAAGIKAFYFNDPDNHKLEIIYFPKGKGQDRWQRPDGKLFLGIDHTAIGVSNTALSLEFYEKHLGITRKGESWNKGIEQAHLNFIEDASLHITGLRASTGPGIEFLEYIIPGPGKPYPANSRSDDLWHWQTTLLVNDIDKLYRSIKAMPYTFISKTVVEFTDADGTVSKNFIVRDRDGHALLLKERRNK